MNITQKISIAGAILGLTSLGYSIYAQMKFKKDLVDKISNNLIIDVPDTIVNEAIEIAVEREVSKVVRNASTQIYHDAYNDIHKEVKSAVDDSFTTIKSSVSSEVAKEVANIDMRRLKRDVEEKAKEMIVEKFDGNLESLLADFKGNLQNVAKIYESIADSLAKKKEPETFIKIGV